MDRKPTVLAMVFVSFFCGGLACLAQDVEVVQPRDGEIVRGVVTVLGSKAASDGYVTVAVRGPSGVEEFVGAAATPFKVPWDSRERTDTGGRRFPDGRYSLIVSGHSPAGETQGRTAVEVSVANDVEQPEVLGGVQLRYKFARNERMDYRLQGRSKVRVAEDPDIQARDKMKQYAAQQRMAMAEQYKPQLVALEVESDVVWSESVIGAAEGGAGTVRKSVSSGWLDFGTGQPQMLSQIGRTFTLLIQPNGKQEPKRPGDPTLMWGEQTIEMPSEPLEIGKTWQSAIGFIPHDLVYADPRSSGAKTAKAQHTLEGFEWHSGYKCARIRSTFTFKGPVLLTTGYQFVTDMKGERITYFAYEQGKQVAFTERLEHEFELQTGGMMGGAIQGTPGLPGAMGMPGGAMPGIGGAPGMGLPGMEMPGLGGGTPGLPGGMPGMAPAMGMPGGMPGLPGGVPGLPGGMPGMPGMGPGMEMPGMPGMGVPGMAPGMGLPGGVPGGMPGIPGMDMPGMGPPGMPGMGGAPGMPAMGGMPGMPGVGGVPGMGGMPGMPGVGGMPGMPGTAGSPAMPGGAGYQMPTAPLKFKIIVTHEVAPVK
jgi:hypothetical protein